jgi:riboflavin synthase
MRSASAMIFAYGFVRSDQRRQPAGLHDNLDQVGAQVFTGIVQDVGRVQVLEPRGGDVQMVIELNRLDPAGIRIGDSICVEGCCLTATELLGRAFAADVSRETLSLTTLGDLRPGTAVNLEPSLKAGDALGGHLVSGHVDGVATITAISGDARSQRLKITVPPDLSRYIARKGSVAVNGVSLTVNEVEGDVFGVNIIPHTQAVTTLGGITVGTRVNLEIDQVARYVERLLSGSSEVW